jgi:hypothetical protein
MHDSNDRYIFENLKMTTTTIFNSHSKTQKYNNHSDLHQLLQTIERVASHASTGTGSCLRTNSAFRSLPLSSGGKVFGQVSQNETLDLEDIFRSSVETQCFPVDANVQHELPIGTIPRGQSQSIQNRIRCIHNLSLILPATTARFEKWAN